MPLPMSPMEMMPIVARGEDLMSAIVRAGAIYILRPRDIWTWEFSQGEA